MSRKPSKARRLVLRGAVLLGLAVLLALFWRPLVGWFTGSPVGGGREGEAVTTQAGSVRLDLALRPDPPRQHGNSVLLQITDERGQPLDPSTVRVSYSMPAMGAMPEMKGEADVEREGEGRYRADFDLPMGGTWTLETRVEAKEASAVARHTFTVGTKGLTPVATGGSGPAQPRPPALTSFHYPEQALEYVRTALYAYDTARAALARDSMDEISERARGIASSLRAAASAVDRSPPELSECLKQGAESASNLAEAKDLSAARDRFSELSHFMIALAGTDPRLQDDWHAFECPMREGFNKWVQRSPSPENPYMGQRMLRCASHSDWSVQRPGDLEDAPSPDGGISHFTCSMHPSVRQDGPGPCPVCGMDLTPVTHEEVESGVIRIDEGRRQRIGVQTETVKRAPLDRSIRALGRVSYDETSLVDVTLKLDGYIHGLDVAATGQPVRRGQVLFKLYSPELYAAQQEYLLARNSQSEANASLVRAARKRLELWGLTSSQIERIAERGEPVENLPFLSPASGYVIEKNVVEGSAVKAGERLFRIAPLDKVWVQADVYEQDLPHVKVGQRVEVSLPYLPGKVFEGRVAYVYPALEETTRTGRIRVELPNPSLELKPDMYASIRFELGGDARLQVPASAVLYTGPRRLVFLDLGDGRFKPQEVKLGIRADGAYEVLEGLEEGDRVVTSGNFLIAAESRIRSAAEFWTGGDADGAK